MLVGSTRRNIHPLNWTSRSSCTNFEAYLRTLGIFGLISNDDDITRATTTP